MKKRTTTILALAAAAFLPSCDRPSNNTDLVDTTAGRFSVQRVGVFRDTLAYENQRGIYLIRDTKTEREYIGVSGIGISEIGSHTEGSGKNETTVLDER